MTRVRRFHGGGDAGGGCFLTTLRGLRDRWLARQPFGRAVIAEYHRLAPRIVETIPPGHPEWERVAAEVDLAAALAADGRPATAFDTYSFMVRRLIRDWLPDAPPGADRGNRSLDEEDCP